LLRNGQKVVFWSPILEPLKRFGLRKLVIGELEERVFSLVLSKIEKLGLRVD
jgi:hypothetical protein